MIDIPKEFGYVLAMLGVQHFMNFYMMSQVMKARKEYDV